MTSSMNPLKWIPMAHLSLVQSSHEDIPLLGKPTCEHETYSYKNCLEHSSFLSTQVPIRRWTHLSHPSSNLRCNFSQAFKIVHYDEKPPRCSAAYHELEDLWLDSLDAREAHINSLINPNQFHVTFWW